VVKVHLGTRTSAYCSAGRRHWATGLAGRVKLSGLVGSVVDVNSRPFRSTANIYPALPHDGRVAPVFSPNAGIPSDAQFWGFTRSRLRRGPGNPETS